MFFTSDLPARIIVLLVAGLRNDPALADGHQSLSVDASHIIIKTHRIDRVVALGPRALGPLIHEMRRKESSLDTFARCYSACDQILSKAGHKEGVRWCGGLIKADRNSGKVIGLSLIGGDSPTFRRGQVEEVLDRAKEIFINLGRER